MNLNSSEILTFSSVFGKQLLIESTKSTQQNNFNFT